MVDIPYYIHPKYCEKLLEIVKKTKLVNVLHRCVGLASKELRKELDVILKDLYTKFISKIHYGIDYEYYVMKADKNSKKQKYHIDDGDMTIFIYMGYGESTVFYINEEFEGIPHHAGMLRIWSQDMIHYGDCVDYDRWAICISIIETKKKGIGRNLSKSNIAEYKIS